MSIILNGVTLNGSLQWTDQYSYSPVAQEVLVTLGGNPVIFSKALQGNQPITLVASEETGWLTKTMVDAIDGMAAIPRAVYTLNLHGKVVNVVFAHHDGPAVSLTPLQPRAIPLPEDCYIGTLKFITV